MPDSLEVDLNDDGAHSIDVETPSFTAEGSFDVVFYNRGAPLHVHLKLDTDLSRAATVSTANHYVEGESVRNVRVRVDESRLPVEGRLEIVTGYGAETAYVSATIVEPGSGETSVDVDERLGEPPDRSDQPAIDARRIALAGIGFVAVLAGGSAIVLVDDAIVLGFVLLAIVGVAMAAGLVIG